MLASNARAGGGEKRQAPASGHMAAAGVRWCAAGAPLGCQELAAAHDTNAAIQTMQNQRLCPAMEEASEVASSPLLRMVVEEQHPSSSAARTEGWRSGDTLHAVKCYLSWVK